MNGVIAFLSALVFFLFPLAAAADSRLTELPDGGTVQATDILYAVRGGADYRVTGVGSVGSGDTGQLAYYSATGTTISGVTYTGSTSITTLGTIGTGTWNATTIAIGKGGTGATTAAAALNALLPSQSGNAGKFLTTNATNSSWATACAPTEIAGHTASSPTAAQLKCGAAISNYGQAASNVNITLPTAESNLVFVAHVGTAQAAHYWRFTAAAAGTMYLDGSATGKDYVQFSAPAVGNYLTCHTFKSGASAYSWICRTGAGTTSTN